MKLILTIAISTLMLSAAAFADTVPQGAQISAYQPVGNGEPNVMSCYRAEVTGTHLTKVVCHRNFEWARLNARVATDAGMAAPPQMPTTP